jgi:phosphatidylethanolamine-binding protein (PEBP) family uncharacterized protein
MKRNPNKMLNWTDKRRYKSCKPPRKHVQHAYPMVTLKLRKRTQEAQAGCARTKNFVKVLFLGVSWVARVDVLQSNMVWKEF